MGVGQGRETREPARVGEGFGGGGCNEVEVETGRGGLGVGSRRPGSRPERGFRSFGRPVRRRERGGLRPGSSGAGVHSGRGWAGVGEQGTPPGLGQGSGPRGPEMRSGLRREGRVVERVRPLGTGDFRKGPVGAGWSRAPRRGPVLARPGAFGGGVSLGRSARGAVDQARG